MYDCAPCCGMSASRSRWPLAERLHHSANVTDLKNKEEVEQHAAPWGPKTARAELEEVVNATHDAPRGHNTNTSRGCGRAVSRSPGRRGVTAAGGTPLGDGMPTLALPSLAGSAGEAVDGAALAFLTSRALAAQKEEEAQKQAQVRKLEERRRQQRRQALVQEIDALFAVPAWNALTKRTAESRCSSELRLLDSASSSSKRKRKKRRKRKLPKSSSSRFTRGRARRRQTAVLSILVGTDQKDSSTVALVMFWLVLLATMLFALCLLPLSAGTDARHHGQYVPEGLLRARYS